MSDLFHEKVSFSYIERVFDVIKQAHHHTFQILTKRAERMAAFCRGRTVPPNPWLEVCVENRKYDLPDRRAARDRRNDSIPLGRPSTVPAASSRLL